LDKNARFTGKRLLVVENGYFLDDETAALLKQLGVVVTRATCRDVDDMTDMRQFDGGVVDLAIEGDLIFNLMERLESLHLPFVFAITERVARKAGHPSPYRLCADREELMAILEGLFEDSRPH
jgi:hypothetical protein